jgi:uncharacterized membrane protein YphA (DoxX/SURF4 family)
MILTGFYRWLAALALGGFTLMATLIALRFWELPAGHGRFMAANAFFEHLGLVGGFLLVAWHDLKRRAASNRYDAPVLSLGADRDSLRGAANITKKQA